MATGELIKSGSNRAQKMMARLPDASIYLQCYSNTVPPYLFPYLLRLMAVLPCIYRASAPHVTLLIQFVYL
jgi:hypothetical protein